MPSNREAYFEALKLDIPKSIIDFILCEINNFTQVELTKRFDEELLDYAFFKSVIERYKNGEMIQYIFHRAYFLSLPLYVDKNVLIPRQETEQLVLRTIGLIKECFSESKINIADVCTGSGCIGIVTAKSIPSATYYLTDISKDALKIAKKNFENIIGPDSKCVFLQGDMLEPLLQKNIDVLICNPPYIEDEKTIDEKTWEQEPHLALLARPCTLFYQKLFENIHDVMNPKYLIAFEIGEDMENSLSSLVKKHLPNSEFWFEKDIYGKTRFLFIKNSGV